MRATPFRCLAAATLALAVAAPAARACPMCKDGAPVDASAQPDAAGLDFNTSIYVMLGVIAVVGGGVGRAMVKAVRG